jgi:hypothetical protein
LAKRYISEKQVSDILSEKILEYLEFIHLQKDRLNQNQNMVQIIEKLPKNL